MRVAPLLLLLSVSPIFAAPPAGLEHPGFRRWVLDWAKAKGGRVHSWWSADLDHDGKIANVAIVCLTPEAGDDMRSPGVYLVEDAAGRRHTATFPSLDYTGRPGCAVEEGLPRFVRHEGPVRYAPSIKRANDETDMAIRDGALVILRQHSGGGRYCEYLEDEAFDWQRLVHTRSHAERRDFRAVGDSCQQLHDHTRREALLLLTRGASTPTFTQVVHGARSGDADSSFTLRIEPQGRRRLRIRIALTDDHPVPAEDRSDASLLAADHVTIWLGRRSFQLARLADGRWFSRPAAPGLELGGEGDELVITAPLAWADWKLAVDGNVGAVDEDPTVYEDDDATWVGALLVAYSDVDSAGGGVESVVATAPLPGAKGTLGLLVHLPHAARWPKSTPQSELRDLPGK